MLSIIYQAILRLVKDGGLSGFRSGFTAICQIAAPGEVLMHAGCDDWSEMCACENG
jgi:hypothetical protein